MSDEDEAIDATLILAAEECPADRFDQIHKFSEADQNILRKLIAHGPVLIRGGRGSGKSALLIEADRQMKTSGQIFSVYVSLRYLPLLQSDGEEYIAHFCTLVSTAIQKELERSKIHFDFAVTKIRSLSSTPSSRCPTISGSVPYCSSTTPLTLGGKSR